jgi:hypothetical protein
MSAIPYCMSLAVNSLPVALVVAIPETIDPSLFTEEVEDWFRQLNDKFILDYT